MKKKNNVSIDRVRSQGFSFLPEPKEKSVTYYVTSFGHEYLNMDYYIDRKDNDLFMINYVVSGSLSMVIEGRQTVMRAGDACFLNLMTPSTMFPLEDETEIYFFHCMGCEMRNIYNIFLKNGENVLHGLPRDTIVAAYDSLVRSCTGDNDLYNRSATLYSLLMEILSVRSRDATVQRSEFVKKIVFYIWSTFPTPSPREIADHFGYSPTYTEKSFKKDMRQSLGSYLLRKRYEQACQCLIDTNMTVGEIAYHVGYSTPQGLNVLFSKFGDLTPLAFRKKFRSSSGER